MAELNWAVEWRGPRGGKYWTGPISEDKAREAYAKKKPGEVAYLLKLTTGIVGLPMRQIIERTPAGEIAMYQSLVKDHRKRKVRIEEAIESYEKKIEELKKKMTA